LARFDYDAAQFSGEFESKLVTALDINSNPWFKEALAKAAERLAEYFRGAIIVRGLLDTMQFVDGTKAADLKAGNDSMLYVDIYPKGTRDRERGRKKAIRNAEVAFVHEYGSSKVPASHWMSDTVDDVGDEISDMVAEGIEAAISNILGG